MNTPETCQLALKEWAITVQALADGDQILMIRKGGIHEESKDFRVVHPEFLLYPTYLHQREDLLKDSHQSNLRRLLDDNPSDTDEVTFTHWARVHELLEIDRLDKVEGLNPHHIWDKAYAESRLHWKPMVPLTIILLRVFRMETPTTVPFIPEYGGCKSWVDVIPTVRLGDAIPVMDEDRFTEMVGAVHDSLGLVPA
jgi:hypothetical protein